MCVCVCVCMEEMGEISTQCNINPVCVPIELSSTQCDDVGPVCVSIELSSTQCGIGQCVFP